MNLPNLLSVSRIILIIPIIFLFEINYFITSCFIFFLASLTDFLDGYLARKNNLESDLGSLLDLLADKLFVFKQFLLSRVEKAPKVTPFLVLKLL